MQVTVFDRSTFKITEREYTDNGFLKVPGRVARTGIQEYLACELGLDGDPMRVIKVMRPESEVFNAASLDSYNGVDVTIEHPSKFVDDETYNQISKGTVLNAVRDGDFVKAELIVKAKDAIAAVESGKVQLSAGYSAVYDEAPADADYDYIQTNIRINHVAIVDRARAGAQARLFDHLPTQPEKAMTKVVLDSGRSIELEDGATAIMIQDSFDRLAKSAKDASDELQKVQATADAQKEKITQLEADLKAANDTDVIKTKLAELAKIQDSARNIAGKEFVCDSVDVMEIKRAALAQVRDSIDWSEKGDEYVNAAFDFADADMKKDEDEEEESKDMKSNDAQLAQLAKDAAAPKKVIDSAGKRNFMDQNMWKVTAGQMTKQELEAMAKEQFGG